MSYFAPSWLGAVAKTLKSALEHLRKIPMGKLSGIVYDDMLDPFFMQ
jgi:hypothetical protein